MPILPLADESLLAPGILPRAKWPWPHLLPDLMCPECGQTAEIIGLDCICRRCQHTLCLLVWSEGDTAALRLRLLGRSVDAATQTVPQPSRSRPVRASAASESAESATHIAEFPEASGSISAKRAAPSAHSNDNDSGGQESAPPQQRPRVASAVADSDTHMDVDTDSTQQLISRLSEQVADLCSQVTDLRAKMAKDIQRVPSSSAQQPHQPMQPQQPQQEGQQQTQSQPPQHQGKTQQPPPRQRPTDKLPHTASPQGGKPAPRPSYASVVEAGSAATAASRPRGPRPPRSSPPCQERKAFIVQTPKGVLPSSGPLCQTVTSLLWDNIPELAQARLYITDAVRVGDQSASSRVYITVKRLEHAEALVRYRCRLKNSGIIVFDVLSPAERKLHHKLWPLFLEARARGQKAQFQRARLMVDGVRVVPPPSASGSREP